MAATTATPTTLAQVIPDEVLDAQLKIANIQPSSPDQREAFRSALYEAQQHISLPLTDERLTEHARHMEMDVDGMQAQLQGLENQKLVLQNQAMDIAKKHEEAQQKARSGKAVAVGTGVVASGLAGFFTATKSTLSAGKRAAAIAAAATAAGFGLGWVARKFTVDGHKKVAAESEQQFTALEPQVQQLAEAYQGLEAQFKQDFVTIHLQRAAKRLHAEASQALSAQEAVTEVANAAEVQAEAPVSPIKKADAAAQPDAAGDALAQATRVLDTTAPEVNGAAQSAVQGATGSLAGAANTLATTAGGLHTQASDHGLNGEGAEPHVASDASNPALGEGLMQNKGMFADSGHPATDASGVGEEPQAKHNTISDLANAAKNTANETLGTAQDAITTGTGNLVEKLGLKKSDSHTSGVEASKHAAAEAGMAMGA